MSKNKTMTPPSNRYTQEELEHFAEMRVVVLVPVMFDYPKFWRAVANMISYSWHHGLKIDELAMTERTVVNWARNDLAEQALEQTSAYSGEPFTHFLWLDSDMLFKPDLCCQLARHDVDMVSVLYFARLHPHKPHIYINSGDPEDVFKHFPILEAPPMLFQVDACGFGGLLMKADILHKVPQPWFTLDWRGGEDISFCTVARKNGVKIFCDGAYTAAHIGPEKIVTKADYNQWYADNKDLIEANREEIQLHGKE